MIDKLLGLLIGAKTGALSGVLVLAGALVTMTGGNGVTTITIEQASPTPTVTATASPTASPTATPTPTSSPTPTPSASGSPSPSPSASIEPVSCAIDAQARADARQRVQEAFALFHTALAQLRGGEHGRPSEALSKAEEMLREIAKSADHTLRELGCPEMRQDDEDRDDDDTGDEDEDEDTGQQGTAASPSPSPTPTPTQTPASAATLSVDATTSMSEVADRAIAAMETVYNAAKALADAPAATPSPKRGEDPKRHQEQKRRDESSHHQHAQGDRD